MKMMISNALIKERTYKNGRKMVDMM